MDILFVDNHLLAARKPAGIATQPTFEEMAKHWVEKTYKKPGRAFLEPIHRLDKPVSGIVLFARTSKALSRLHAMMRERKIAKTYRAEVEGIVAKSKDTLEHYLVHDEFHARVSTAADPEAKKAILSYNVVERTKHSTILEITLHTGRYHQIRAQLSAIGHPILGDDKYGSRRGASTLALEHTKMEFIHPVTLKILEIHSL